MDRHGNDHQTWISDLGRKFPAVREWLRSITPAADQDALLDSWELALADLELEDCLAANQAMVSGDLEIGGSPDRWQFIAARVRRHVQNAADAQADYGAPTIADKREHERTVFVRERLKEGLPRDKICRDLVAAGYEGIAVSVGEPRQ